MKSSDWYIAIVVSFVALIISVVVLILKQPAAPIPCQDSTELRRGSDSQFKCHHKATLNVKYGEGVPSDYILVTCQCRQ